ncbi:GAF domain-containing protein [Sedimentibacter acidaminivorans]|uniref:GAF domain-containing protein n=1 Tax=Sedimentibacter acidaminivorans TaxID=913099 RepID=A0ABS4GHF1_9FIRM|nr:GAF domain-containing protein [Sedimentibacter acidaminivorans]MBP1927109.1 GAF domain-containing protein [Sedimentibacter acidaminivorans]
MKAIKKINFETKDKFYNYLNLKLTGLICEEKDWLANLSNASALLWLLLDKINWAGFYLYKNEELVLGPFQGKPACTHIEIGKGVCGTSIETKTTQLVMNVHDFPGHIACDSESNSEIVVPIIKGNKIIGVLDIDSPIINRFDNEDKKYLEKFVDLLIKYIEFPDEFI